MRRGQSLSPIEGVKPIQSAFNNCIKKKNGMMRKRLKNGFVFKDAEREKIFMIVRKKRQIGEMRQ